MKPQHVELWKRLEEFQLDSQEAALPFSARLARENNWSAAYTQRVIAEYKRFAFLTVAAGQPVSPSENVDQAWHLHLTYTQSYWKVFCPQVLQTPLHHQPTQGGAAEREKFDDWYQRTLESYREHFGEEPPSDIWPAPEAKRTTKQEFIRVDRRANWVVPKPGWLWSPRFAVFVGLLAFVGLCTGAAHVNGLNPFDWTGPQFLQFYGVLCVAVFTVSILLRRALRLPGKSHVGNKPELYCLPESISGKPLIPSHSPSHGTPTSVQKNTQTTVLEGYELAYLNRGRALTVNAAIANLANQKLVQIKPRNRIEAVGDRLTEGHPLERAAHAAARNAGGVTLNDVRLACKPVVGNISDDLKARGLVVADPQAVKAVWLPLLIALALPLVGGIKVAIGLSRGRPVIFLAFLTALVTVAALVAFARRPLRTRFGDAVLSRLQSQHGALRHPGRNTAGLSSPALATTIGLFGLSALAVPHWTMSVGHCGPLRPVTASVPVEAVVAVTVAEATAAGAVADAVGAATECVAATPVGKMSVSGGGQEFNPFASALGLRA